MDLKKMRDKLDEIDDAILKNIGKRFEIVSAIAGHKMKNNLSIKDKNREEEILKRLEKKAQENKINFSVVKKIFRTMMSESRDLQNKIINKNIMSKIIIGVSGNLGSFSEEAAKYYANKNGVSDYELKYLISVENVLSGLDDKNIDLGVFPIENSNGGIVYEAVYAMAKHLFSIEKMFEIDVKHCLLVKPGVKTSSIKKICSHQQALKQCRMYLKRRWNDVELEEYADTAQAAKDLSEGKLNSEEVAVIAPARCADIYNLDILEEGIQDLKFNFTTFIAAKN